MTDKKRKIILDCKEKLTEESIWKVAEFLSKLVKLQEERKDENKRKIDSILHISGRHT